MMNELIFFIHTILVACASLIALKLGKESLVSFICMLSILSNLFVTKQMMLFGFDVTCSDVFAVGGIFGLNLIQEFFGKTNAKKTIVINFFTTTIYLVMSQIHLWYHPNVFDTMHAHFFSILQVMPRITIASMVVYLVVQLFDAYLYSLLKTISAGKYLVARNIFSLSCSQFIDTVLFSFLALYGIVGSVWHVIVVSYFVKLLVIVGTAPFIALAKKFIPQDTTL